MPAAALGLAGLDRIAVQRAARQVERMQQLRELTLLVVIRIGAPACGLRDQGGGQDLKQG
jgi:hypothetical protein